MREEFEFPDSSALPIKAVLFTVPEERELAAVAAPVPCLNPFGGRSQGGLCGSLWFVSSCLILETSATEAVVCVLPPPPLLLLPTPDDLTRLVWATRSKNRRSNLLFYHQMVREFEETANVMSISFHGRINQPK